MHAVQPLAYDDASARTDDDAFLAALPISDYVRPTSGALEALENARLAVEHDPVCLWLESHERHESLVFLRALRLATDLETCEAILRGELVPASRIDPEWRRAYGL
jgi:hypothetical protein